MSTNVLILLASAFIMLVPFAYTYFQSRGKKTTAEEWTVGGRDLPIYVIVGTQFASAMGGGVLVALVDMGYRNGLSTITYGLVTSLPFIVLMILAPWLRENKFDTIPDVLKEFYGEHKGIAVLGAFFSLIVPFGWITSQLGAFGQLYEPITGVSGTALTIGIAVISLFFIMPSGLKTVAWSDFIFACFMIIVCGAVLIYGFNIAGGTEAVFNSPEIAPETMKVPGGFFSVGSVTVLVWLFSVLPGGSTNQIYYQRIVSIKDPKKVNLSLIMSAVSLISAISWAFALGTIVKSLNPSLEGGKGATAWFMSQLPTGLVVMFAALVCATIMSTISSAAQTCVTNMTADIYKKNINPNAKDSDLVGLSRKLTIALMILTTVLSLVFPAVLGWLVYTYAFSAAGLFAPIFMGYFTRKTKPFTSKAVFSGMIISMIVCILAKQSNSFGTPLPFAFYGVVANAVTMIGVSLFTKKSKVSELEEA